MSRKVSSILGCAACALSVLTVARAYAQEAEAAPAANEADKALDAEISYVEALIENGLPDFAEPVIEETKKKWPESETAFFALEIRGMLMLGKTEEAEKKIAALPDRKSSKYWAARLEVANNHFGHNRREECKKIYEEFFKNNQKPAKELVNFARQARYQWGQILMGMKRFKEAADNFVYLLGMLNKNANDEEGNAWCNVACGAAEIYLRLAAEAKPGRDRDPYLASAQKLVKELLWEQQRPLYFGRAIAMRAHYELLKGNVAKAQGTIDDYMEQLADLHKQVEDADPDGRLGLLKQSPMPQCRYMLAEMLWNEALAESRKPKKDDERIKSLMFGEKMKNGKRNKGGAYNHAINVFIKYPQSTWASKAGDLAKTIAAFAEKTYNANIKTSITKEQEETVRAMQFKNAKERLGEGDFQGAIDEYMAALSNYPECHESIMAIENIVNCYISMIMRSKDKAQIESWRMDADAVEGYLAERFGGARDKMLMTEAGDATLRLAAKEKQLGNLDRAKNLYDSFLKCYDRHVTAAQMAAAMAYAAQKDGNYQEALEYYKMIETRHQKSSYYMTALINTFICHEKLGDVDAAFAAMDKYIKAEKSARKAITARLSLASLYQKDGFKKIDAGDEEGGVARVREGVKMYGEIAAAAAKMMADPNVAKGDKAACQKVRENALFYLADCWSRVKKPAAFLEEAKKASIDAFEEYVNQYPKGRFAKAAYFRLGVLYTQMNNVEKTKDALARLRKEFPDSVEAKKAMPSLARNLIEYANTLDDEERKASLRKESARIYEEMIKGSGADYQAIDFVRAGESLIAGRAWTLADEAFEKAIAKAGTNQLSVISRARIGKAQSLYAQNNLVEARESLDEFFADEKLSRYPIATNACYLTVKVAMEQGREEQNDALRGKHYGAAVKAVQRLRGFWAHEPQWKKDSVNLMSADIKISRIEAERALGKDAAAAKTRGIVAAEIQNFIDGHKPAEDKPLDKFAPEELANLEEAYSKLLPLLVAMGADQAERAWNFGQDYLQLFPSGKSVNDVRNYVNQAEALLGDKKPERTVAAPVQAAAEPASAPAPAAEPAAEAAPASAETPAE